MRKEEVSITYYNGKLNGIFFFPNEEREKYPVICKVHGLVSNKFEKEEELASMFTSNGIAYFTFHQSGFFESSGEISIQSSFDNLDQVLTYLTSHPRIDPLNIGVYGVSMGAAIATCHCARDTRVAAVALQAPVFDFSFVVEYPEFTAMIEGLSLAGLVKFPKDGIRKNLLEDIKGNCPLNCIKNIAPRPLLIIAGEKDNFIPFEGIVSLYANAFTPKQFEVVTNADHNLTNYFARYETFHLLLEFFTKAFFEKRLLSKTQIQSMSAV